MRRNLEESGMLYLTIATLKTIDTIGFSDLNHQGALQQVSQLARGTSERHWAPGNALVTSICVPIMTWASGRALAGSISLLWSLLASLAGYRMPKNA